MSGRGRGTRGGSRGGSSRGGRGGLGAPSSSVAAITPPADEVAKLQEERKRVEERRLQEAEEERRKAIEEQQRRLKAAAEQERNKLIEQRRIYEEQIKIQRDAVLKAEIERMRRLEEAQQELARRREAALRELVAEKEIKSRLENMKDETDRSRKPQQQVAAQSKPQPIQREKIVQRQSEHSSTTLSFHPKTYDDHQILNIYVSRSAPDPMLPDVQFSKRGKLFYLGLRKCEIVDMDGDFHVKLSISKTEDLRSWLERVERVEGLRIQGLEAAKIFQNARTQMSMQ